MIVNERVVSFINSLNQEDSALVYRIEQEAREAEVPIVRTETRELLKVLELIQRPKRLLEVGTAVGFSSIYMSRYLPEGGKITTIEKYPPRIVKAKENISLAGIPWWTTDIGGFMTDDVEDEGFRELLLRWFELAVFSPILRMHGDRGPHDIPPLSDKEWGGGSLYTGHSNELWSYGEEAFGIMKKQWELRLSLKPYIENLMKEAADTGAPLLRTMFYEFPEDKRCWELEDQYMFGDKYLVAPIFQMGQREREVYLPAGRWKNIAGDQVFEGGQTVLSKAPIEWIPVFERTE